MKMKCLVLAFIMAATLCMGISIDVNAMSSRIDFTMSKEEKAYVAKNKKVTVALSPDNFPYSENDGGNYHGIIPEFIQVVAKATGIEFEILPCEDYEEYSTIKKERKADIVFATHLTEEEILQRGYQSTSSYMTVNYSMVQLRDNSKENGKVAVLEEPSPEHSIATRYYYNDKIVVCKSKDECINKLTTQEVEAIIVNSYEAQDIIYSDVKSQFAIKQLHDGTVNIYAGVRENLDPQLYSIVTRAIDSVDDITKAEILDRNTQIIDSGESIIEVFYIHPEIIVFIAGACIFFILLMCVLVIRLRKSKSLQRQSEDFKRFLGYICTACDSLEEVDLYKKTATRYMIKDGVLIETPRNHTIQQLFFVPPEEEEKLEKQISRDNIFEIIDKGEAKTFECRMKWHEEDEYRWCSCIVQGIIPTKERPASFLMIVNDINDLREEQEKQKLALEDAFNQAKQASQAKGQFLSKMSHEIRTPLNAVIGYMAMGKDARQDVLKMEHCIEKSEIAAKHLLNIINDVLDISSIESGKMKIAKTEFDLKNLIGEITEVFYQQTEQKGIHFDVVLKELTQEWGIGDGLRVNQVLMNLLSNAVKFTPKNGTIKLMVEQVRQTEDQVFICFAVRDSGIGMSPEYKARLFQPFEQESATTAQKYGGSGLGLSITKNLIDMMGGNIKVESEVNKGTTFTVTLYFDKALAHQLPSDVGEDYSHVRVLVVDDEKDAADYIKMLLKRCKVKSDVVTSGENALKQLKRRASSDYSYDMCIMDWNMPELNGVETAREIRNLYGDSLPIIIATAYDTVEIEDKAKEAGVNQVVAKPLFQSTMFDLLVDNFGKYDPKRGETQEEKIDLTGLHILLAEDNEMNMEIALDVLGKSGIMVDQAEDGQEAYYKFTQSKPGTYDLILMDIQMPIMNGYKATEKIRKSDHEEAKTIPIIAMTANAFAEDVAEALANGMNDHIAKPIDNRKLLRVIQKFSEK